jgi:Fic family protein
VHVKIERDRKAADSRSTLRLHEIFQSQPYATANDLVKRTGLTVPTVNAALVDIQRLGVIVEITGRRRGRVFSYPEYLSILNEGTAPLPQ